MNGHENHRRSSSSGPWHRRFRLTTVAVAAPLAPVLVACENKSQAPTRESTAVSTAQLPDRTSAPAPSEPARVEVSAHGFQPSRVELGENRQVTFRRTSDETCATAVAFPDVGIEKQLPLNTDVVVELPPTAKGDVTFQCGMGMYRGKVVAR